MIIISTFVVVRVVYQIQIACGAYDKGKEGSFLTPQQVFWKMINSFQARGHLDAGKVVCNRHNFVSNDLDTETIVHSPLIFAGPDGIQLT